MSIRFLVPSVLAAISFASLAADACELQTVYTSTHHVAQPVHVVYETAPVPHVVQPVRTVQYVEAPVRRVVRREVAKQVVHRGAKQAARGGATVAINGDFFGSETGRVFLKVNGLRMDAQVISWSSRRVLVKLPEMTTHPAGVLSDLQVFASTGRLAKDLDVLLQPALASLETVEEVSVAEAASTTQALVAEGF